MVDAKTVDDYLRRLFHGGVIRRMPRNPPDADMIMALSLVDLDPAGIFGESEINVHLSAWLDDIASETGLDYVTLRRFLVDGGFLRRASDGVVYRIVAERIDEVLSPEAKTIDPKKILSEVRSARDERRRMFRS